VEDGRLTKELAHSLETMVRAVPPRTGSAESSKSAAPPKENVPRRPASSNPGAPFGHPYYWSGFTLTGQ
jgi:CHAT domain-containing protein